LTKFARVKSKEQRGESRERRAKSEGERAKVYFNLLENER